MIDTPLSLRTEPREPLAWLLLPLAVLAFAGAVLFVILSVISVAVTVSAATTTGPIPVELYATTAMHPKPGTHSYSGGPYIADGTPVTATEFTAGVSGLPLPTRLALTLGGTIWVATIATVATMIGTSLMRLRRHDESRLASHRLLVAAAVLAIGSIVSQVIDVWADVRLGHVSWIGQDGVHGFTAISPNMIDLTPLGIAAAMLAIVVVVRRGETKTSHEPLPS